MRLDVHMYKPVTVNTVKISKMFLFEIEFSVFSKIINKCTQDAHAVFSIPYRATHHATMRREDISPAFTLKVSSSLSSS